MRRLLLILIPLLLLVGLYAALPALRDWRYIPTAAPGEVLYVAAFDGFLDEWEQYEDGERSAQAQDGALRLAVDADARRANGAFSSAQHDFTDFDLRVQARAVDGPLNNAFGVMFRLQDKNNREFDDDDYYAFLISSDGYYRVNRVLGREVTPLSTWIPSPLVQQGIDATNWLRVVARGDTFRFYINDTLVQLCVPNNPQGVSTYNEFAGECVDGQMLDSVTDSAISSGQLGALVSVVDEPGTAVTFDNLLVFAPEADAG